MRLGARWLALAAAVTVAATTPGAAAAGTANPPRVITWTIHSRFVDVAKAHFSGPPPDDARQAPALRVDAYLPAGYDGTRRYPVLYLLHGHGDTYQTWSDPARGDLLDIARHLEAIVVMPEGAQGWYTNWWDGGARGRDGRAWEDYFIDEVIPSAESRLRILPGRQHHAIAGVSMGGEGALYFAAQLPGYFGSAASLSGTISIQRLEWPAGFDTQGQKYQDVYGDPQAQRFYWAGHDPTALTANLTATRLFVRAGNGVALPLYGNEVTNWGAAVAEADLSLHAGDFVAAARRLGEDVTYQSTTGIHDWPWWRPGLAAVLAWNPFGPPAPTPSHWTYETVSTSGQAWDVRFAFSAPPATVETFTRDGDTLRASGSGTVTITPAHGVPFTTAVPFSRRVSP